MGFVKFHNMNRKKKFSNVAFKLKKTQKVSLYNKSKQYYNHSSKMFSFLFFFFQSMYCLFKKNVRSFFPIFFSYAVFNNVQASLLFFFFLFHLHCPVAFFSFYFFLFSFFSFFFYFIINCSFTVPFFFNLISTSLSLP